MRSVAAEINQLLGDLNKEVLIVHVAKGLELNTYKRVSEVLEEVFDPKYVSDICVLSGPSHAEEVAEKQPTTVSTASIHTTGAEIIQDVFMTDYFRVYVNNDMVGVEIGGALKILLRWLLVLCPATASAITQKPPLLRAACMKLPDSALSSVRILDIFRTGRHGRFNRDCHQPDSRNYRCGQMLAGGLLLKRQQKNGYGRRRRQYDAGHLRAR